MVGGLSNAVNAVLCLVQGPRVPVQLSKHAGAAGSEGDAGACRGDANNRDLQAMVTVE